jgi:hypothetical protein
MWSLLLLFVYIPSFLHRSCDAVMVEVGGQSRSAVTGSWILKSYKYYCQKTPFKHVNCMQFALY